MTKPITNKSHSLRSRLLNVAKREGLFFQTVLTRYFHERLLYRVANSSYISKFYLKGGSLIYALNGFAARPTLDVDLLGVGISNSQANIVKIFKTICDNDCYDDGVKFDSNEIEASSITELKDYSGVRLSIPVRMDTIKQRISIDIGFGDVVTPGPVRIEYPSILNEMSRASLYAYPVETIFAEKLHAVIELGTQNSRMKDYFDLYNLLQNLDVSENALQQAVNSTFLARHTIYTANVQFYQPDFADNKQLIARWNAFLKKLGTTEMIQFSQVVSFIQQKTLSLWTEYANCTKPLH